MPETPGNNASITRGRPFQKGNPGRPRGARHRCTLAAEALLDGEAEALTRKAIEKALEGDTTALRLVLERILPPRKDRPVRFVLPILASAADATAAMSTIIDAVAMGELTPAEGGDLARLVEGFVKAAELQDLQRRVEALEAKGRAI